MSSLRTNGDWSTVREDGQYGHDVIVCGFRDKHFVVVNVTTTRTVCAGHWSLAIGLEQGLG
jgi:hypothetical protein